MGKFARLLAVLLIAVFAAAALAPAAEATAMAVKMSLTDSGGCEGCPEDGGDQLPCEQACITSLPALAASLSPTVPALAEAFVAGMSRSLASWTGPPDPSPPRRFS